MLGLTPGGFYTTRELADVLKLTPRTVQRWIDAGQLPAYRFGRKYRVRGEDVETFLDTFKAHHSKRPVTDTVSDTQAYPAPEGAMNHQGEHVTDMVTDTPMQAETVAAVPGTGHVTDTVTDTVADTAATRKAPARSAVSDTVSVTPPALEPFDTTKYRLGKLCPRGHDYQGTGQSLRVNNKAGYCLACNAATKQRKRAGKRQATVPAL